MSPSTNQGRSGRWFTITALVFFLRSGLGGLARLFLSRSSVLALRSTVQVGDKRIRRRTVVLIPLVVAVFGSLLVIGCGTEPAEDPSLFAKPVGALKTTRNERLRANITTFMEAQKSEDYIGKDHYYCSNILYGYDDKYAYAWVYCSGFVVKNNQELEEGTGSSVATRLEYTLPHFQIIAFEQPDNGSLYLSTLQQLFPQQIYQAINRPSDAEMSKLDEDVRRKAEKNT